MTQCGTLDYVSKGGFDEVTAIGYVEQDSFVQLYEKMFLIRQKQKIVHVLVNILECQAQLSLESFSQILQHADDCEIGFIDMTVITQDPGRPLVGGMLEALADEFKVNVKLTFLPYMPHWVAPSQSA